jgi:hypothetical protein
MDMCTSTYMSRQVFPQAPSPTITSFRRISAMVCRRGVVGRECWTCVKRVREAVARTEG